MLIGTKIKHKEKNLLVVLVTEPSKHDFCYIGILQKFNLKMFGVKHNECVGFESRWRVIKVRSVGSTQTEDCSVSEKSASTSTSTDTEVQTTEKELEVENVNVDMQKLNTWLQNIYPLVKRELNESSNSQAFKGYKSYSNNEEATCRILQQVNVGESIENYDRTAKISSLSWNTTGKTLAIACKFEHHHWCYHTGYALIYTLTRDEKIPNIPRLRLSTESCILTLKFHPKYAAILAAATYSGKIIIWNIQKDEDNIFASVNAHEEIISQLSWVNDSDLAKSVLLVTSGSDGLLKLWNFNFNNSTLALKTKYKIKPPLFIGDHKHEENTIPTQKIVRGVACFDFSKHIQDMFVVGLEGGIIVQCSTIGAVKLKGHTVDDPLLDPVFKYYSSHKGEITHISFSPNRREIFMTYGTDAEIRFYVIGQEDPAQIIFLNKLLNDVTFIPHEEKLIVGCGTEGLLEIFNIITAKTAENVVKKRVKRKNLTTLAINTWRNSRVVVGNTDGQIQLWDVPWQSFSKN